jgi:DNA adenine methylase
MKCTAPSRPNIIRPFLKWAGGKRWLISEYSNVFPRSYHRYFEPFLGGGAIFFYLQPPRAFLGDVNRELIVAYCGIRDQWREVERCLKRHKTLHSEEYYYSVRSSKPRNSSSTAARLIYLNRTCFNGIYRVNQRGDFNVPRGTRDSVIFENDNFKGISSLLKNATLSNCDFEVLIEKAKSGDLVFADPPYTVAHNVNGFVKYNETLFSWDDQIRLAKCLRRALTRGVQVVATNANHAAVRALYENSFRLQTISRYSSVAGPAQKRGTFEELLITG